MKKTMLVLLIGLIGGTLLVGCGEDKNKNTAQNNNTKVEQTEESNTKNDGNKIYDSGFYEVGKDIPAEEYLVLGDKKNKQAETSVLVTKDSKKENDIFEESDYGDLYVTVMNGEFIDVKNGKIYPVETAPTNEPKDKVYKNSMYKVGRDIKAGTYEVKALKEDGTVEIYKDSRDDDKSVISKQEFKNTISVTLKDGEYVGLEDAEITVK